MRSTGFAFSVPLQCHTRDSSMSSVINTVPRQNKLCRNNWDRERCYIEQVTSQIQRNIDGWAPVVQANPVRLATLCYVAGTFFWKKLLDFFYSIDTSSALGPDGRDMCSFRRQYTPISSIVFFFFFFPMNHHKHRKQSSRIHCKPRNTEQGSVRNA